MTDTLIEKSTTRGKVQPANPDAPGDGIIFLPSGTNYQLHLAGPYAGPVNRPVSGTIRLAARKLYTVTAGGNFIAPILGTPRTVQGRVVALTETRAVVHCGANVLVDLPTGDGAMDFANGPLEVGARVNFVALPGARFELADVKEDATAAVPAV